MKKYFVLILTIGIGAVSFAQQANTHLRNGNKAYKESKFEQSQQEYNKALSIAPKNPLANYNMGNALFRNNKTEEAVTSYDNTITNTNKAAIKEQGYYNKGVALAKQQKLQESIDAWKNALKLDPNDQQARENLQKALLELKKQQQQQQQQDKKEDEKKKEQEKKENKDKQQQQQKPQSKLNKKQVEQLLKALQQREREVQQRMQSKSPSAGQPDKDW